MMDGTDHVRKEAPAPKLRAEALVFTRDGVSEAVIRQCLSNLSVLSVEFFNTGIETAITELARRSSPKLLIVDVSGTDEPIEKLRKLADVCEPGTGVIVIGDTNDIIFYRSLINAGVVEYYFKPLVGTLIARTANGILNGNIEKPGQQTGKLMFVLGVRGGVGATTVAVSAAWTLAETFHRRVVLLDLDMCSGDAALQLDVTPTHALREALEHPERVDDLFLERATIHVTDRLRLLASLEPFDDCQIPDEDAVLSLLKILMLHYRYIFVDVPVALAPNLFRMLHLPSACLLVSNGSLVSAREVARWRATIGPNSPDRQTLHIINRVGEPGGLPEQEFLRAAGQAGDFEIAYDRGVATSSTLGIRELQKCAALRSGMAPLFSQIAGELVEQKRSFVSRIFGRP